MHETNKVRTSYAFEIFTSNTNKMYKIHIPTTEI